MHADEVEISAEIAARLVAAQLPEFANLDLRVVEPWGTDNAIWRLGDALVLRFPRIGWATNQVGFEAEWLPRFARELDVVVPEPVAVGEPGEGYPFPWAVHRWVPGTGARLDEMTDPAQFAVDLARVARQIWSMPTVGAPRAKNRARAIAAYDSETRRHIDAAAHLIDAEAALEIWEEALAAPAHDGPPVWVHGDLEGNCVLLDGHLHGLVDWGLACAGDPAIDVQVVWSPLFTDATRQVFLNELSVDAATLARSRGAAINQACGALPYYLDTYPLIVERSWHKLAQLGVGRR